MAQLSSVRLRARRPSAAGGARRHELTDRGSSARSHARSHAGTETENNFRTHPRVNLFAMRPAYRLCAAKKVRQRNRLGRRGGGCEFPKMGIHTSVGRELVISNLFVSGSTTLLSGACEERCLRGAF